MWFNRSPPSILFLIGSEIDRLGRKSCLLYGAAAYHQNVVDHRHHSRGRHEVGHNGLGSGYRSVRTGHFGRKQIVRLGQIRVKGPNRLIIGFSVAADTADHLTGVLSVARVNVDQILRFQKYLMAELPGSVVIHSTD